VRPDDSSSFEQRVREIAAILRRLTGVDHSMNAVSRGGRASAIGGALVLALSNCGSRSDAPAAAASVPGSLDDMGIENAASELRDLTRISTAPFPTKQHAGNALVNVYANALAEDRYRAIVPGGAAPAGFTFPAGSLLVKEMLDPSGGPSVLTAMYKRQAGYDPAHGDWWYGRLNSDGTPTNPAYAGRIEFCVACHSGTARWDYAWGIATASQSAR
jgi:hypothetical protein